MPLLCDMRSCKQAMPTNPLPSGHVSLAEDAEIQVKKAVEYHKQIFGVAPQGMWPSEGSVSPDIIPLLNRHGIKRIATDEETLSASIETRLRADSGKLSRPDLLCSRVRFQLSGTQSTILI